VKSESISDKKYYPKARKKSEECEYASCAKVVGAIEELHPDKSSLLSIVGTVVQAWPYGSRFVVGRVG
jgi:hypothetical protein